MAQAPAGATVLALERVPVQALALVSGRAPETARALNRLPVKPIELYS